MKGYRPSLPAVVARELGERNFRHLNEWRLRFRWHRDGTYNPPSPYREMEGYFNERRLGRQRLLAKRFLMANKRVQAHFVLQQLVGRPVDPLAAFPSFPPIPTRF